MKKIITICLLLLSISSYSAVDLENGLVAYYPFNGDANDKTSNHSNMTVTGATLVTDRNNNSNSSYSFNGTSNKMTSTIDLKGSTSFSISVWIKSNQSGLAYF